MFYGIMQKFPFLESVNCIENSAVLSYRVDFCLNDCSLFIEYDDSSAIFSAPKR